jgi:hypothetical protein
MTDSVLVFRSRPYLSQIQTTMIIPSSFTATSAESAAFIARTSGLSDARKTAYDALITSLVSDGVFAKLDALYVFAAPDATTALLNLVQNLYNATNSGATFTADAGYTGDGSSAFIDSGFNPSTASTPNFVQDSAVIFGWSNTIVAEQGVLVGDPVAVTGNNAIYPESAGGTAFFLVNGSNYNVSASNGGASKGLYAANRSSSLNLAGYKDGASFASASVSSTTVVNANLVFLKGDNGLESTRQILSGGIGESLSSGEHANLYARLHTYHQTYPGVA